MIGLISDLQTLIRQPSISAKKQGLIECAGLVASIMNKAGINAEVLYLGDYSQTKDNTRSVANSTSPSPIVDGEAKSKANPNGKTVLFYNHYDVQLEEPVELCDMMIFLADASKATIFLVFLYVFFVQIHNSLILPNHVVVFLHNIFYI